MNAIFFPEAQDMVSDKIVNVFLCYNERRKSIILDEDKAMVFDKSNDNFIRMNIRTSG